MDDIFYKAEIYFDDGTGMLGHPKKNFKECIPDLEHFVTFFGGEHVTKVGIFKRDLAHDTTELYEE